jgi:uncharacterized protein YkwD
LKAITTRISALIAALAFCQIVSAATPYKINPGYQNLPKNVKETPMPAESSVQPSSEAPGHESGSLSPKWRLDIIDTTAGAEYLTKTEREVIIELNMMRTDPPAYARHFLEPMKQLYRGKLLQYPGEIAIATSEGVAALEECIKALSGAKPLRPFSPKKGLTLAARYHAKDQAETGAIGHAGSDGSTIISRVNRYGRWSVSVGENIDYGNDDARRIVSALLIDDGVPSRGHRKNMLDAGFRFVGVAAGSHNVYRHMCVMDFAGAYD